MDPRVWEAKTLNLESACAEALDLALLCALSESLCLLSLGFFIYKMSGLIIPCDHFQIND